MKGLLGKMNTQGLEGRSAVFLSVLHWHHSSAIPPLAQNATGWPLSPSLGLNRCGGTFQVLHVLQQRNVHPLVTKCATLRQEKVE